MIYPKISIVTPSYNHGAFIEQTILSVLGQNYPNLEYIIIDGGSTDNTVDIIKKYTANITYWVSEKDNGQSNAINKGLKMATGDILGWLNSDDYYLPGVFFELIKQLNINNAELLYGNCIHLNELTNETHGSYFNPFNNYNILEGDFITQPSSFWTSKAWEINGRLNEDLTYTFDWEWYARAWAKGIRFVPSATYFSVYRVHEGQKSNPADEKRTKELFLTGIKINPQKYARIESLLNKKNSDLIMKLAAILPARLRNRFYSTLLPRLAREINFKTLISYLHYKKSL